MKKKLKIKKSKTKPVTILVFDTETTGLVKNLVQPLDRQPEIIEFFGMLINKDGYTFQKYHQLYKPSKPLPNKIIEITGLTDNDLATSPKFSEKYQEVKDFIEKAHLVVAHNLRFDMDMVNIEMARVGERIAWPAGVCTVECTEYIKGRRMKLMELHEHLFGEGFVGAHRAENDVEGLVNCYVELRSRGLVP